MLKAPRERRPISSPVSTTAMVFGATLCQVPTSASLMREISEVGFQFDICWSVASTADCNAAAIGAVSRKSGAMKTAEYRVPMVGPFSAYRAAGLGDQMMVGTTEAGWIIWPSIDIFQIPSLGLEVLHSFAQRQQDIADGEFDAGTDPRRG